MKNRSWVGVFMSGCLLCSAIGAMAGTLEMPPVFTSEMVIQAEMPVPVWGWAKPSEKVEVTFAGQTLAAKAGNDGLWMVKLAPMKVSFEGRSMLVKTQAETKTFDDVLVGEVWLCSGQSNMPLRLPKCKDGEQEVANANDKDLRFFSVPDHIPYPCDIPMEKKLPGNGVLSWKKVGPGTAADISAIGYFFAKEIRRETKRPVGIVLAARGGSNAECWVRREALMTDPVFAAYVAKTDAWNEKYPEAQKRMQELLTKWGQDCKDAKANGQSEPARPKPAPADNEILALHFWASSCYNTHLASIKPYAVRGVLWYQGENNGGRSGGSAGGYDYQRLLPLIISDWRKIWGQERMPFYIVQLANFSSPKNDPDSKDTGWPELREAQAIVSEKVQDCGLVVTMDIGDPKDIHPGNKQEVGRRLALIARSKVYGQNDVIYSGPRYRSMKEEGNAIRLEFDSVNGGLVAKDGKLAGFTICGDERKFVWGDAKIDGNTVVVSSPAVATPVAVRYAWQMGSESCLFNGVGQPASPFRTDDWPGLTWPKAEEVKK